MRRSTTKRPTAPPRLPRAANSADPAQVDALYGLEPVYEPGQDPRQRPLDAAIEIECPHCWQSYESSVDLTLGAQSYIEDCQHCCHPIAVSIEVVQDGRGAQVSCERL